MKRTNLVKGLIVVLLALACVGCRSEEKSYYHYLNNPQELQADYAFCQDHPGNTLCDNILAKYHRYYKTELKQKKTAENKERKEKRAESRKSDRKKAKDIAINDQGLTLKQVARSKYFLLDIDQV